MTQRDRLALPFAVRRCLSTDRGAPWGAPRSAAHSRRTERRRADGTRAQSTRTAKPEATWELVLKRNPVESLKQERSPLGFRDDLPALIAAGYESVPEEDMVRLQWWGLYRGVASQVTILLGHDVESLDLTCLAGAPGTPSSWGSARSPRWPRVSSLTGSRPRRRPPSSPTGRFRFNAR